MHDPVAPSIGSVVEGMLATVVHILPGIDLDSNRVAVEAFVRAAYEYSDRDYNIDKAVTWGDNVRFPVEAHLRDSLELAAMSYDLLNSRAADNWPC